MTSASSADAAAAAAALRADQSDLDPAAFLQSVRELSEKRDREDIERYRKLEAEIEKTRQARALRRADRARSISPEKSVASSPSTLSRPTSTKPLAAAPPLIPSTPSTPLVMDSDPSRSSTSPHDEVPEFQGFGSTTASRRPRPESTANAAQPSTPSQSSPPPQQQQPSATSLARSGTLSWQQRRPTGQPGGPRHQSTTSATGSLRGVSGVTTNDEVEPSRDQIAASLSSRDPSWFRQTAERGVGNAAYRKSKDEPLVGTDVFSGRRGLPGMSRGSFTETSREASAVQSEAVKPDSTSRSSSVRESIASSSSFSTVRSSTTGRPDLKSLIAEDEAQEKAAPMAERTPSPVEGESIARTHSMSLSQARLQDSNPRPSSPTKGMGGFVQSAMMKRSDSVNKRAPVQPASGIGRNNSVTNNRSGYGGLAGSYSMPKLEPAPTIKPAVVDRPASRPGSRDSNPPDSASALLRDDESDTVVKPARPYHSRSKSVASNYSTNDHLATPPASPSKRFSPTKSTWLESAIAKPESPRPMPARNSQPSWMANIAKAKAQRASGEVTPKALDAGTPRSASPTKPVFGQGILKRSESRDLDAQPRPSTPTSSSARPRSTMPDHVLAEPADVPVRSEPLGLGIETKEPLATQDPTPVKEFVSGTGANVKTKPETPPKPQTDFRANLRPRAPTETKKGDAPEFLSKFGNLRKATTQNYVAPDLLKDNILRGKADLSKTGGPVKSQQKDEFKDSLLAKKEQWKKEKEEGIVSERKTAAPITPQKPEALAKRELLGRALTIKAAPATSQETGSASSLARQTSLPEKSTSNTALPTPDRQSSVPIQSTQELPTRQLSETSKLAARFNPGLAGMLARGPPTPSNNVASITRTDSPVPIEAAQAASFAASGEPTGAGAPLDDMRKGRAKGPKRRKGAAKDADFTTAAEVASPPVVEPTLSSDHLSLDSTVVNKPKPQAPPGSAASIMMGSLRAKEAVQPNLIDVDAPSVPQKSFASSSSPFAATKPARFSHTPVSSSFDFSQNKSTASVKESSPKETVSRNASEEIAEFRGFGSSRNTPLTAKADDNKENTRIESPSVKAAASKWGRPSPSVTSQPPGQIQLPSKKDEEAAMRSAGLLASSPGRPTSRDGSGSAAGSAIGSPLASSSVPAKPARSSRIVSGQLQEASPNKSSSLSSTQSPNEVERQLAATFGFVPASSAPLMIDTQAVLANSPHQERTFRTVRKTVQVVLPEGTTKQLPEQEDYTFFDQSVHICTHAYTIANGPKKMEIFLWVGKLSTESAVDQAQTIAKKQAKESGNAFVHTIRQGLEPPGFLQALGGILITRRGARTGASRQYMLCGRKHLGQIAFDEVQYGVESLCHGFVYLISYPVTLQETKLYLWKGSESSPDEVSAARLAAMDLSETGDVIEVDGGAEFSSFLKIFGTGTTKANIPTSTEIWQRKALNPNTFAVRLFRIQPAELKPGIFSSIFTRRPSWNNLSPGRRSSTPQPPGEDIKVEAVEPSPFTQADLEADNVYVLDAYSDIYILVGPVFASQQSEAFRSLAFSQTLRFAAEYAMIAAAAETRPLVPKVRVILSGVPPELKLLFRQWDDGRGLWGTSGLMAGSRVPSGRERTADLRWLDVESALAVVCRD